MSRWFMWEQDQNQGSLRGLEPNLVTMLDLLWIDIIDCKYELDIVDCSLGIVPPKFLTLKRVVSLVFLGHHILYYLLFCYVLFHVMII